LYICKTLKHIANDTLYNQINKNRSRRAAKGLGRNNVLQINKDCLIINQKIA